MGTTEHPQEGGTVSFGLRATCRRFPLADMSASEKLRHVGALRNQRPDFSGMSVISKGTLTVPPWRPPMR